MGDMRTRSRGSLVGQSTDWGAVNESCATIGIVNHHGGPFFVHSYNGTIETTSDVVTRGYRRRSMAGEIIINPYSSVRETYSGSGNFFRIKYTAPSCMSPQAFMEEWIDGPYALTAAGLGSKLSPNAVYSQSQIDALISVASTKAWSDANQHDANILQDIAESRQLVSLLKSPKTTASKIVASAVKTRGKSLPGAVKSLGKSSADLASDLWLQYQYGVRPLVSTLNGVVDAIARYRKKHRWTARGNSTLSKTVTTSGTATYWMADFNYLRTDTHEVKVRAGILLEEEVRLTNNLGVDASGLLSLPWELIPFSFVADWFINVGSFISAIVPSSTKTPIGSWVTVEETLTSTFMVTGSGSPKGSWSILRTPSGMFTGTVRKKYRIARLAGPSIAFKPDSPIAVLTDKRALDSAALVFQKLGKVFKG